MEQPASRKVQSLTYQVPEDSGFCVPEITPHFNLFVYGGKNSSSPFDGSNTVGKKRQNSVEDHRNGSHSESEYPPYRIMVVDDEPDSVTILKKGLEQKGFCVVGYTNPEEALANFARHKFDIVLTDVRMPQMNGIDLYKQMRAIDSEVLICFVTAYEQYRQAFEIAYPDEQVGCFISKPISIERLVGTINRKMEEREGRWRGRV